MSMKDPWPSAILRHGCHGRRRRTRQCMARSERLVTTRRLRLRIFLHDDSELGLAAQRGSSPHPPVTRARSAPANEHPGTSFPGAKDARFLRAAKPGADVDDLALAASESSGPAKSPPSYSSASTAPDTDFIVRVSDVYPDGRSTSCSWTIRCAPAIAKASTGQVLLKPGDVRAANCRMHLGFTSLCLQPRPSHSLPWPAPATRLHEAQQPDRWPHRRSTG